MMALSRNILSLTFILCLYASDCFGAEETTDVQKAWDNVKKAFKNIGDYFAKQIKSAKDMEATSVEDLKVKVNDTLAFLQSLKKYEGDIKKTADEETQKALEKLDIWIEGVQDTANKIDTEGENSLELWKNQSQSYYESGMDKLIAFAQNPGNSAHSVPIIPSLLFCSCFVLAYLN